MDKAALAAERAAVTSERSVIGPATQRRKRWITAAVLGMLAVTVVAILVVYIAKKARREGKPPASVELPSNVDQQASGFTFTRSIGGRQVFKIQAARTQALNEGGSSVLDQVYVEIYGKTGTRRDTLRTQRAEYNSRSGDFTGPGKVEIELNARPGLLPGTSLRGQQPVYLETSGVHFDQEKSLAVTEAPVRFRIGPASGSAVGMTYATREGWLELTKDVVMDLRSESVPPAEKPSRAGSKEPDVGNAGLKAGAAKDAGLKPTSTNAEAEPGITRVVANRVLYKKESNQLTLDGPVELSQTGWKLTGAGGKVFLDSQNRPTQTVLEGDVHFSSDSTSSVLTGTTPRLVADFNPATAEIRHLVAEDGVEGESRPQGGPDEPSDFEARQLGVTFSAGHHPEPVKADAFGNVKFIFRSVGSKQSAVSSLQKAEGSRQKEGSWQKAEGIKQKAVGSGSRAEPLGVRDTFRFLSASYELPRVVDCRPPTADCQPPSADCQLPTADCLLPTAYRLPPPARSPQKTETLTASEMLFGFRPDGRSLKEAQTVGAGKLVLNSEDARRGEQVITAGQFLMTFNEQSRLRTLDGVKGTHIVYKPGPAPAVGRSPAAAPPQPQAIEESFSDRLNAVFDTASSDLRSLEQSGNFRFSNGERQSSAAKAEYSSESQVLTLSGRPRLWDATTRIAADRILWHLDTETGEGLGKVQSTHFQTPIPTTENRPRTAGKVVATGPPGASANAVVVATNVLADQVIVERRSQLVQYQGHVRAWHDHDVIESSSLDYDGVTRRLSSGSQVLTSHLAPTASPLSRASPTASAASKERAHSKTAPVAIRADSLTYFDEDQKASYRGHVELRTEQTTLKADKMDVYFTRTGGKGESRSEVSEVDHVLADDHVTVAEPGRRATGDHCEYLAAPGKVTLTGGPPTVYDEQNGLTTGQRLTFFVHDDSLYVDGGDQSPTITKHRVEQ